MRVLRNKESECLTDMRGKHENRGNIISEEIKQKARNRFFFCSIIARDIKGSVRESKRYVKVLR